MKYNLTRLEDIDIQIIDGDRGKNYPKNEELFEKGFCLFLSAKNVTKNGFCFSEKQFITKAKDDLMHNGKLVRGDIIITTRGTIGNVALYSDSVPFEDIRINSGMLIIRCGEKVNNNFLYHILRSKWFYHQILTIQSGSAQPQLPKSHLQKMCIPFPDFNSQIGIGTILSSLDDKIELNNKINENLEQQAQALYQFFFIENTSSAWKQGTISDLGVVIGGSTPSKAKAEYYTQNGIAWITPKDLSVNKSKFITHGETDITELGLKNSSASIMPKGTVLFSSRAPIGYIAIAAGDVTTNQGFKSVVPKPEIGTAFVYYFLKHNLPIIEAMASGSTFKEISGSTMKNVPAVVPDSETLAKFNNICKPIFAQQQILETQNQSLAALRDSILPRLLNGEIEV